MPLPVRRAYAGAAEACTLSSSLNNSATSFSITGTTTGWPNTATGPFYMVIDPGLSTEEKVLVGARTSGSLSSVTRGLDGTTAAAHDAGATCYPVLAAVDLNEANLLASTLTTKGDLLSTDGSDPKRVAVGSNNTRLVADSAQTSGIKWVADTQNTVIDAKGDLLVGSAADTVARLAVGTDGYAVVADSAATNGLNYSPLTGFKNGIINGDMRIFQRSSFSGASQGYSLDRWHIYSGSNVTVTRSTAKPTPNSQYSLLATATGTQQIWIRQALETLNAVAFAGKTVTVSAYAAGLTTTTNLNMALEYSTSEDVAILGSWSNITATSGGNLTLSSTMTRFTGVFSVPSDAKSLRVSFVNNAANITNGQGIYLGDVQLEVGSVATPFETRSYGIELALCQRYYYRINPANGTVFAFGQAFNTTQGAVNVVFPVTMRIAPTAVEQSGTASHYLVWRNQSAGETCTSVPAFHSATTLNSTFTFGVAGNLASGDATALLSNSNSAYLGWSVEL